MVIGGFTRRLTQRSSWTTKIIRNGAEYASKIDKVTQPVVSRGGFKHGKGMLPHVLRRLAGHLVPALVRYSATRPSF